MKPRALDILIPLTVIPAFARMTLYLGGAQIIPERAWIWTAIFGAVGMGWIALGLSRLVRKVTRK